MRFKKNCSYAIALLLWTMLGASSTISIVRAQELQLSEQVPIYGLIKASYNKVIGAKSYEFKLEQKTQSGRFRQIGEIEVLDTPKIEKPVPYGVYKISYRPLIGSVAGNWVESEETPALYPSVMRIAPKPHEVLKSATKQRTVRFLWEKNQFVFRYRIDVEESATGKVNSKVTADTSLELTLDNEKAYRWRVIPDGAIKPPKDPPWHEFTLTANVGEELADPQFTEASFDEASWTKVSGASSYIIALDVEAVGAKPKRLFRKKLTKTSFKLKRYTKNSKGKTFKISVQALGKLQGKNQAASKVIVETLSEDGTVALVDSELKPIKIVDKLPETNIKVNLDLSFGGENLKASGLLGRFNGDGLVSGGILTLEILPKPESNMMFMQIAVESDGFSSKSTVVNESSGSSETVTTAYRRLGGTMLLTGRSDLGKDFYGLGVSLFTQPMPIFEAASEETGQASLDSLNLRGIGGVFHGRHSFLGGQLMHYYDYSPFASQTRNLALFNVLLRQRYSLGKLIELSGGVKARYVKATAQNTCSKNQKELCSFPKSTQTMITGLLGVDVNF